MDAEWRNEFFEGALECAQWADSWHDGDQESFDGRGYSVDGGTLATLRAECDEFVIENASDLIEFGRDADQCGHDFHLSRNHHGTGFWDRGKGDIGERLHEAATAYGEFGLYLENNVLIGN